MKTKDWKLIAEKQAEYIKYLVKAISSESIIRDITDGVRKKYESELSLLESQEVEGVDANEYLKNN